MGKKWSELAAQMNRNEHAVKNRFNSLLIKQKKLTPHVEKEDKLIRLARRALEDTALSPPTKAPPQPITHQLA